MMAIRMVCHYPGAFASLAALEGIGALPDPTLCLNASTPPAPMLVQWGWHDALLQAGKLNPIDPFGGRSPGGAMADPPLRRVSGLWGLGPGERIAGDGVEWQHTRYLGRGGLRFEYLNFSWVAGVV